MDTDEEVLYIHHLLLAAWGEKTTLKTFIC